MKRVFTLAVIFFALCGSMHAQDYDTIPPYEKNPNIPDFNLMQTDSSWFIKANIPFGKSVVIIYFSPDCGHCQLTAHEYEENISRMDDVFFVWVSYLSLDKIKSFAEEYKMLDQKNIRIGRDPNYFIPAFYKVKFTPFMAVYDAAGKLLKTYEEGTDPDTLIKLLHPAKSGS